MWISSTVGILNMKDSIWNTNSVEGYGAVLYLEVGSSIINNITMKNSNYNDTEIINEVA